MRRPIVTLLTATLVLTAVASRASAVSLQDLVNLRANGLGDEILVALIETDGSAFDLSPTDVIELYRLGLSERVILALIASGRGRDRPGELRPNHPDPAPSARVDASVPPVVVRQTVVQVVQASPATNVVVVPTPVATRRVTDPEPARPVYWGFGGRLRPDAWRPAEAEPTSRSRRPSTRP